jgi:hypothetical protein
MVGVLALYSAESGVFEPADLGALLWIRTELACAVKHAQEAGGRGAGESYLRANLARLEAEVARSRADGDSLGLLVCALQDADIRSRYGDHAWSKLAQSVGAGLRRYSTLLMRAGNEYMLALPSCAASELAEKGSSVTAMAESIAAAHLGDRIAPLRAGSALFPEEAAGAEELLAAERQPQEHQHDARGGCEQRGTLEPGDFARNGAGGCNWDAPAVAGCVAGAVALEESS